MITTMPTGSWVPDRVSGASFRLSGGNAEIDCGPWRTSASAGEFLFFPADIAHQIRSLGPEDLEFIVCAASTTGAARGMSDGGLLAESGDDA